jgi:hypothetical protein
MGMFEYRKEDENIIVRHLIHGMPFVCHLYACTTEKLIVEGMTQNEHLLTIEVTVPAISSDYCARNQYHIYLCVLLHFFPNLSSKNGGRGEVTIQSHTELTHVLCRYFPEHICIYIHTYIHTYTHTLTCIVSQY